MWKMIGFVAFWIAVGMLLMLLFFNRLTGLLIIGLLLVISYNVFCGQ